MSSAHQQIVGRIDLKLRRNSKTASSHSFGNLELAVFQHAVFGLKLFMLRLSAPAVGVKLCPLKKGV